jgi:hypothetical protein
MTATVAHKGPKLDVFERAEEAGKFRPLREQALRPDSPDPEIAVLRYTAALAAEHGLEPKPKRTKPEPKGKPKLSRHEEIVQRISTTASEDDGYRVHRSGTPSTLESHPHPPTVRAGWATWSSRAS